jgi:hypothetical protein
MTAIAERVVVIVQRACRAAIGSWAVVLALTLGTVAANEWSFDHVRLTTRDGHIVTVCAAVVSYRPADALPGGGVRFPLVPELSLPPRRSGVLTGDRDSYDVVPWNHLLAMHLVGDGAGQPGWSIVRTDGTVLHGPSAEVWIEGEVAPDGTSPVVGHLSWSITPGDADDPVGFVAVVFPTNLVEPSSPAAPCPPTNGT